MPNQTLLFDEDFIADCREAALPDGADEMVRCYGCKKIWPASEISGGLCGECADPIKEDDDEDVNLPKAKGPRSAKAGEEKLGTGLAPACDHTLAPVAAACQGLKGKMLNG